MRSLLFVESLATHLSSFHNSRLIRRIEQEKKIPKNLETCTGIESRKES